jgi:hypothetical protein
MLSLLSDKRCKSAPVVTVGNMRTSEAVSPRGNSATPKLKTFYINTPPVSLCRTRTLTVRRSVSGTTRGRARPCQFSATNVSPCGLIWEIYFSCEPLNHKSSSA